MYIHQLSFDHSIPNVNNQHSTSNRGYSPLLSYRESFCFEVQSCLYRKPTLGRELPPWATWVASWIEAPRF